MFFALFAVSCGSSEVVDPVEADPTSTVGSLGAGLYPVAMLDITVTHPETDDVSYSISCLGDTATITGGATVDGEQACGALSEQDVRIRLIDGAPVDQVCTEIYGGPDVATIDGTLDGEPVSTTVDRSNGCGIDDWDRLLVDVLPSAIGVIDPPAG